MVSYGRAYIISYFLSLVFPHALNKKYYYYLQVFSVMHTFRKIKYLPNFTFRAQTNRERFIHENHKNKNHSVSKTWFLLYHYKSFLKTNNLNKIIILYY